MSNDIRKFMKLVESASLNEKDTAAEVDVPLANMPRDMSTRDDTGRVAHADVSYNVGSDKVIATLKSYNSQVYTKLAQKLQRIDELEAEVKKLKDETKAAVRSDVAELFAIEDFTRTRVIETKQFIFTLSKDPKATEAPKYKDILEELSKSLTPELITVLEGLKKTMITTTQKAASLKLAQNASESMNEGIWDTAKDALAGFFAKVKAWGAKFDSKLAALKAQAGVMESKTLDGVPFVEDEFVPEGIDYGRVDRIEKQVDFMAGRGRSRDEIVSNISAKMGNEEGEHAATYFDTIHGVKESTAQGTTPPSSPKTQTNYSSPWKANHKVKETSMEVSEDDVDSSEDRMMREYEEMMETMGFKVGQIVYNGSRAGKVVGEIPDVLDAILVELPNGQQAAFKKKDCTTQKPGMLKRAASWVVGENEDSMEDDQGLTEWDHDGHDDNDYDDRTVEDDIADILEATEWQSGRYDVEVPFTAKEAFLKFIALDLKLNSMEDIVETFGNQWEAMVQSMTILVQGCGDFAYKGSSDSWARIDSLPEQLQAKLEPFVQKSKDLAVEDYKEQAQGGYDDEGRGYGGF
jgi:hypothetical protein